jgi:anti-sigma B factor antagonist
MVDHLTQPTNSAASAHHHGFEVRKRCSNRVVVLSVHETVDILSAPQLSEAICEALGQAPTGLIVDLTDVDFLASVGMSVLVSAHHVADAMSVRFGIVADGAATSRPIRLIGLNRILTLYPTLADALREFREGTSGQGHAQLLDDESTTTQSP